MPAQSGPKPSAKRQRRSRVVTVEQPWPQTQETSPADTAAAADPVAAAAEPVQDKSLRTAGLDEEAISAQVLAAQCEVEKLRNLPRPRRPKFTGPTCIGAMICRERPGCGRGWVAQTDIPAGTTVLCETPLAFSMDWEADELNSDAECLDTAALIISLVRRLALPDGPQLLARLQKLSPRQHEPTASQPWLCSDDSILAARVEDALDTLSFVGPAERVRLKQVVRQNGLGLYTSPEQLCHPQCYANFSGTGLFLEASFFNHGCRPNVCRFNIGSLGVFRTNREVTQGEELVISYIESDVLAEPAALRNMALGSRDFTVSDDHVTDGGSETMGGSEGKDRVDIEELQSVLSELPPEARLANVSEILTDEEMASCLIKADRKELDIVAATVCRQLGLYLGPACPYID